MRISDWSSDVCSSDLREYTPNPDKVWKLQFFCSGDPYEFCGLFEADLHLVCPAAGGTLFLLGTDRLGRDMLSRIVYGTRISMPVGLIGIAVSFLPGLVIGGLAGYYAGWIDASIPDRKSGLTGKRMYGRVIS